MGMEEGPMGLTGQIIFHQLLIKINHKNYYNTTMRIIFHEFLNEDTHVMSHLSFCTIYNRVNTVKYKNKIIISMKLVA